jgi:hypothetical protein
VPPFIMAIEEVYYTPQAEAVDQIAYCPGQNQGEAERGPYFPLFDPAEIGEDEDNGYQGCNEEDMSGSGNMGQETKGSPPVLHVDDAQKTRDDLSGLMEENVMVDNELAHLVQGEEDAEDDQQNAILPLHYLSSAIVWRQRWQSSGCSLFFPTLVS